MMVIPITLEHRQTTKNNCIFALNKLMETLSILEVRKKTKIQKINA